MRSIVLSACNILFLDSVKVIHAVKAGKKAKKWIEKPHKEPKQSNINDHSNIGFDGFIDEGLKASGVHVVTRALKKNQRVN